MQTLWFILLAAMLIVYVILDGFDIGAGVIHFCVAHTDDERRAVLRSIGPVWDGNEVWLIAAGGTLFFAFPVLYAASFSGFYLPLIIVLWLLIMRGVAIELRSHINSPVWKSFWDGAFVLGSTLLAIFFGAALGNVVRGVSMNSSNIFFSPLWTDFSPFGSSTGILDWYTILVGLFALAALTMHGACYIVVKTVGAMNERARRIISIAWIATIVLAIIVSITTFIVQPMIEAHFSAHPWILIFPLFAVLGLAGVGLYWSHRDELRTFFSSCLFLFGMLASAAAGLYPIVLPARTPANSLTIQNASSSLYGQTVGLFWWTLGMILAVIYFVFTYRLFWGKVPAIKRNDDTSEAGRY